MLTLLLCSEPPPLNSKPEGISLDQKTYTMSQDTKLFQPPTSYPEAPKNMYYKVPETKPESQNITQVFPWESHAPRPTRVFPEERPIPAAPPDYSVIIQPDEPEDEPKLEAAIESAHKSSPPPVQTPFEPSAYSFEDYTRSNAWDEDPHIQRYIETVQQAQRPKTQVISGSAQPSPSASNSTATSYFSSTATGSSSSHRPSTILTDFPSEVDRPSLPVTPAPIRRDLGVGSEDDNDASTVTGLPAVEGVPSQADWVGVTADAFSHVLRATYLLWRFTEPHGSARRAPSAAV